MKQRPSLEISIDCYAGHRGEQTPRRLTFDGAPSR